MEHTLEHRIRQRAYEIWHAHGQINGKADEHWLAAEREVLTSLSGHTAEAAAGSAKPQKRARASRAGAQRRAKPAKARAKS